MGTIEGYEPSFDANAEAKGKSERIKLYGTTTSPYTRKIRILMSAAGLDSTLVDTRTEEGAAALADIAPLGKVPVVELPGAPAPHVIPDSGLIATWLWDHHGAALRAAGFAAAEPGSDAGWGERERLVVIEGALDAAINRFYLLKDKLPDQGYVTRQGDRVRTTLAWLDRHMPAFSRPVSGPTLSLGCALDWMVFRAVVDLPRFPRLAAFRDAWTASRVGEGTEPG
jgi:glutathione S-transferase